MPKAICDVNVDVIADALVAMSIHHGGRPAVCPLSMHLASFLSGAGLSSCADLSDISNAKVLASFIPIRMSCLASNAGCLEVMYRFLV